MKKVILSLAVIAFALVFSNKAFAQYPIPSFDVPIVADPTTFEEGVSSRSTPISSINTTKTLMQKPGSREEKDLNIEATDGNVNTTAWAIVNIYAIDDNSIVYGPYTITEGTLFTISLSVNYDWGVRAVDCSHGCEMDIWFD